MYAILFFNFVVGDVALGVRQIYLMFVKSQVKLKDNQN